MDRPSADYIALSAGRQGSADDSAQCQSRIRLFPHTCGARSRYPVCFCHAPLLTRHRIIDVAIVARCLSGAGVPPFLSAPTPVLMSAHRAGAPPMLRASPKPEDDDKKPEAVAFLRRDTARQRPKQGMLVYLAAAATADGPAWLTRSHIATKYEAYATTKPPRTLVVAPDYGAYGGNASDGAGARRPLKLLRQALYWHTQGRGRDPDAVDDVLNGYNPQAAPADYYHPREQRQTYHTFKSHILNREDRDINLIVRQHYNQRTKVLKIQGSRTKLPIYRLRTFNNVIKYMLLGNFVKRRPDAPLTFLDLCCGKGGDLFKCEFVGVDQYIGVDISDQLVHEAFHRYSQQKARFKPGPHSQRDPRRYNFEACFATGDLFSVELPQILEPNFPGIMDKVFPVDAVLIQFLLHYSFETEEKVRQLLVNVLRSLRPGGTFVGTIPSLDFIRDKIVRKDFQVNELSDRVKFGNDIYSVTFDNHPPVDGVFRPPFGNRYDYFLQDAVDNVPEYVVPFETLRALCEEYGLVLKYKKNFLEMFAAEIPKYFSKLNRNLIEGLQRDDGKYGVEGLMKEAVAFYLAFAFEKVG